MNPSVLMLGWEYPPLINGGLGLASMGLAEALSELTSVQLILPNSQADSDEQKIKIIGLDQIDLEELWDPEDSRYVEKLQDLRLSYVNIPLSGYQSFEQEVMVLEEEEKMPARFFELRELYGRNLPRKIIDYSEICIRLAEDLEFDIIHAHDWMTFPAALEIHKQTGKPLVLHIHSLEYDRGGPESKNWVFQLEQKAMQDADMVFTVSHYTAEIARQEYGIKKRKIRVVHNAIEKIKAYRREKPFKDKLVSFVGRLESQKGPEYFFQMAMEILARKDSVRFVMAGKGSLMAKVMDQVSSALIGDKFHFTGFMDRPQVLDLMAMTDVFVMPSDSEPFGLVALEATQMGVPCIVPFQSGISEIFLETPKFQAGDSGLMAEQVLELLDNPEYHQSVLDANQTAIAELSWEKIAEKVISLYKKLL
ncbi:MAG: glycosyltransferase family 4 protein [Bacteroidia bacterium]|nr:glycosyltransferase family 4 protein [Bacteroidia bacterium]